MQQLTESVRDGTFDFTLTKPVDAQLIATFSRVAVWKIIDIFLGLAILIIALVRMGNSIGGLQTVEFLAMLLTGSVIVYSFFLILATLAFWLVRVENVLTIFLSVYHAGRWPLSLYPGWLRYGLIFVIPVAFATTIPVEALTSRLNWVTLLAAFGAAVVLFAVSRAFWKFGLRHYSGASA
jgi:ABC-2 type transport system permease protein